MKFDFKAVGNQSKFPIFALIIIFANKKSV